VWREKVTALDEAIESATEKLNGLKAQLAA
jgi:hypothetical protein